MSFTVLSIAVVVLSITVPGAITAVRSFTGGVSDNGMDIERSRERDGTRPGPVSIESHVPANVIIPKLLL